VENVFSIIIDNDHINPFEKKKKKRGSDDRGVGERLARMIKRKKKKKTKRIQFL